MTAAAVLAVALVAGCSGGDGGGDGAAPSSAAAPGGACAPREGERPARSLLRCGRETIAYVETDFGTGTGVVVEVAGEDYVLTNVHVVDPFRSVDLTLDGETVESVPVAGADVAADIALVGPLRGDRPTLELAGTDGLEQGDDVFVVGYPAEVPSDDVSLTVSKGIVSRFRELPEWDQRYVQTDANSAGGQSGGPLFDERGRIVGIIGLSFGEEQFRLALAGQDVARAAAGAARDGGDLDRLLTVPASVGGPGDDGAGGATSGSEPVADAMDIPVLWLPPSEEPRTWNLAVPAAAGDVTVDVWDPVDGDQLAMSASTARTAAQVAGAVGMEAEELLGGPLDDLPDDVAAREVSPGNFRIELEGGQGAEIDLGAPLATGPTTVEWTSDQPLWRLSTPLESTPLSVGEEADGLLGGFDTGREFQVELAAGQEVEISASSPQGDVLVRVVPPGVTVDARSAFDPALGGIDLFDDSDVGLFGYDVRERFRAEVAGTYRMGVGANDGVPVAWRFVVRDCADADACERRR